MMVNTSDDDDNDDIMMMLTIMCSIQNPSSYTEEVSGIIKRMWVELLISLS
jgi:hypothetical protein